MLFCATFVKKTTFYMTTETKTAKSKNRETTLLIIVAVIGVVGLAVLQFARKGPAGQDDDRTLVQAQGQQGQADPQANRQYQRIPGNLISTNEYPEQNKPFYFRMENFSQGAVYDLDLGDGNRKPFINGVLQHIYRKSGPHNITLYAKYEGQEVALQTITQIVARQKKDDEMAPIMEGE